MKTFKQLREDLQSSMSKTVGGVPLSYIAARKKGIERNAQLHNQSKLPPKNPMKMNDPGSTYTKTSGGIVKFPAAKQQEPKTLSSPNYNKDALSVRKDRAQELKQIGNQRSMQKNAIGQIDKAMTSGAASATKPAEKPITKNVAQKPAAPLMKKTSPKPATPKPVTPKPAEKDPNAGGGFVTAGVSKGPSGELRTVNVSRGKVDSLAMPHKKTGLDIPLQKAKNVDYVKPQDWKQATSKQVTGSNLPPQGSAGRDQKLAQMGYKKF